MAALSKQHAVWIAVIVRVFYNYIVPQTDGRLTVCVFLLTKQYILFLYTKLQYITRDFMTFKCNYKCRQGMSKLVQMYCSRHVFS